ncbi:MAG: alcohol dehydrogenase catalytic domain-containing protein [Planctomycetota bacterium]
MRAAVLTGRRRIEIRDVPALECGPGQVVVRPVSTGICGTEQHVWNGEFEARVAYPAILGHEFGGRIARIGPGVMGWREGDAVVVDPIIPCRQCTACHTGRYNACGSLKLRGIDLPGAMAEEVVCDAWQLFRYPAALPLAQSALAELYSIGCHAASRAALEPADTVAVFGAGKVGLAVIDVLKAMGVHHLFAVDPEDARLARATRLGADLTVNPRAADPVVAIRAATGGAGVDRVIEAVGHFDEIPGRLPPVAAGAELLRPGGRMVVLGQGPQSTPLFFKPLVWKEIEIVMSRVSRGEFARAVRLMESGRLHPDVIITHTAPLAEAGALFEAMEHDRAGYVKVILAI